MMFGRGANPVFFNKKNKDWKSRILGKNWRIDGSEPKNTQIWGLRGPLRPASPPS